MSKNKHKLHFYQERTFLSIILLLQQKKQLTIPADMQILLLKQFQKAGLQKQWRKMRVCNIFMDCILSVYLFFWLFPFFFNGLWDPFKPKAEGFGFFFSLNFFLDIIVTCVCTGKWKWNIVYTSLIYNLFPAFSLLENRATRAFSICFFVISI